MVMSLLDLNDDCLLHIFKFCSDDNLLTLCLVHNRLQFVIEEYILHRKTLDLLMCGHRNAPIIEKRNIRPLTYAERFSLSRNWVDGRYKQESYFFHPKLFPTQLHLDNDFLYVSYASTIRQYRRLISQEWLRQDTHQPINKICSYSKTDIACFTKKNDTIFGAHICGNCFIYEKGNINVQRLHSSKDYLFCLDFCKDLYATGSDYAAKLWRRSDEFGLSHLDLVHQVDKSVKSLKIKSDGNILFFGLGTDFSRRALRMFDIQSGTETFLNSDTLSICDLKLKDDNVIFTTNVETTDFRMHDRRANSDVAIWVDPFDTAFYCLEYDGLYGVLCGAKYHSRVNLYDIRMTKKYIHLFFPSRRPEFLSSSVHSVVCDSRYLFIATDHDVLLLDFKA